MSAAWTGRSVGARGDGVRRLYVKLKRCVNRGALRRGLAFIPSFAHKEAARGVNRVP